MMKLAANKTLAADASPQLCNRQIAARLHHWPLCLYAILVMLPSCATAATDFVCILLVSHTQELKDAFPTVPWFGKSQLRNK